MKEVNFLDHALDLAKRGFHVFPLEPGSKLPLKGFTQWQLRATRDPKQIQQWWKCPVTGFIQDYNIGISTSHYGDDKALLVVDVDVKGKANGNEELFRLELDGHDFPTTLRQTTPTGGTHIVYVVERPVKQGAHVLAPGLDIRSRGGYIVGSGSVVQAGVYTANGAPLTQAPGWLVERLSRESVRTSVGTSQAVPAGPIDPVRARSRAEHYLTTLTPAVEGERNHRGYQTAAKLKDLGVSEEVCLELMAEHWACEPMLDDSELAHVVRSAYHYGKEPIGVDAPEAQFPPVKKETPKSDDTEHKHPFDVINKSFAFVVSGGKHHILWEKIDADGQPVLEHLKAESFHKMFASWEMQVGKETSPVTKEWMRSPRRRSYDGLVFIPGKEAPMNYYNLWRGFSVKPSAIAPKEGQQAFKDYLQHARDNICRGDPHLYDYLIKYFAHMMQRPWEKPLVTVVFRGSKGVGKNAFVDRMGDILGGHYFSAASKRYLTGNFNAHMENCLLLTLEEAFWAGDKEAEGILKHMITGKKFAIEPKGEGVFQIKNLTRIVVLGNEDWLVPASHDERRFVVFDVGEARKQDGHFFDTMEKGMLDRGGLSLLLDYLLHVDLTGFEINRPISTKALVDQKMASLPPLEQWWYECLAEGALVSGDWEGWPARVETERFRRAFTRYSQEHNIRARIPSTTQIGVSLARVVPGMEKTRKWKEGERCYYYKLPDLDTCRKGWNEFIGHDIEWEKV